MRDRRAGFTLIELIIAILLATIVLGAVYRVLQNNQRFYRAQSQILDVQQNIRAVAQILPGEFRELDAGGGDIIAMSDTAITIKAMRGFSVVCSTPSVATGQLVIKNALTFGYRAMDATRDSVVLFREADPQRSSDDRWLHAPMASMTSGVTCDDGAAGTRLTLTGMIGGISQLDSVLLGAPLRTFEVVNYRLYQDESGSWWLGARTYTSGSWSATSPIAGPLRATDGLRLQFYDAADATTEVATAVAQVGVTVRGRSTQPIMVPGRSSGNYQDSLTVRVALRNN